MSKAFHDNSEQLRLAMQIGSMYAFEWNANTDKVVRTGDLEFLKSVQGSHLDTGQHFLSRIHPDDVERFKTIACGMTPQRTDYQLAYRFIRPDSTVIWLEERGRAFFDQHDRLIRILGITADITKAKLTEAALHHLGRKLMKAHEDERTKIARELHDNLGADVVMLVVGLQRLINNTIENDVLRSALVKLEEEVQQVSSKISSLSHQLHASDLELIGLADCVKSLCNEFSKVSSFQVTCKATDIPTSVPYDVSLCFYRVLQEALHNATKHSQAKLVEVELTGIHDEIILQVTDDGVGFNVEMDRGEGLGLISMRERMSSIGGSFRVSSKINEGTRYEARASGASRNSRSVPREAAA